jgi:hypothetical protein
VGIDLDKCRDPETGVIESSALDIIQELDTFTELSPSRTGIHLWAKGSLPQGGRRKGKFEVYDGRRYFTVTGQHVRGTPQTINERATELSALHARIFGSAKQKAGVGQQVCSSAAALSDDEIIQRARSTKNAPKFTRLWAGQWQPDHPSQSEADLALCKTLAFWSGRDSTQMDRLFRRSGLYRKKWDERRGADGRTYGQITIAKAVAQTTAVWRPKLRKRAPASPKEGSPSLPPIIVNCRQLRDVTADAVAALKAANDPPVIFDRVGTLVRLRRETGIAPFVQILGENELRSRLCRVASYFRIGKGGNQSPCPPPLDVVRDVMALGEWDFPPLEGVTEWPVLRPDGTILQSFGYDPVTRLWYEPATRLVVPPVPDNPTGDAVAAACDLLKEPFADFPFLGEASEANAVGLALTQLVRPAIRGSVPAVAISAPQPGTGKGLLVDVVSTIATGRPA